MAFFTQTLARISHMFSAKRCLKYALDETAWIGRELRCPVCGQLIAYAYPSHGVFRLYVTYRYQDYYYQIFASSPLWMDESVPKDDPVTINWDLLRPPIEPLLSDTWDDEKSYQKCVQEYIQQVRKAEVEESSAKASNTGTTD